MVHPASMERIVMRPFFAALVLTACASAAQAAPVSATGLPESNVVEFDVLAVAAPSALPGFCAVTAVAGKVWQGSAFRPGQPLFLSVPCAQYGLIPAHAVTDGPAPVQVRSLQQSRHGIARLSDSGELLWQDAGGRSYGPWGEVAGYRVLDVRMLPVTQS
jgi:hypothetical protein